MSCVYCNLIAKYNCVNCSSKLCEVHQDVPCTIDAKLLDLPNDLLEIILLKTPFEELANVCTVNKRFSRICDSPSFILKYIANKYQTKEEKITKKN